MEKQRLIRSMNLSILLFILSDFTKVHCLRSLKHAISRKPLFLVAKRHKVRSDKEITFA